MKKARGSIRVFWGPDDLNKSLIRPIRKTPTLEEVIHQFHNTKVFSKLDAKNEYWSIRLDEPCSKSITFNAAFSRYRFFRLPLDLVLSQNVFQQKMVVEKCPGCVGIADDDVAVIAASRRWTRHSAS